MSKTFLRRLQAAGLADPDGHPHPDLAPGALEAFAPDNQTSQVSSTRTQTRRLLVTNGFSPEQAEVLVPKGRQGRPRPVETNYFPGLSKAAAEAVAQAIGLDEYEGSAQAALRDPSLWGDVDGDRSQTIEEARLALLGLYKTTASAQKAHRALLAGLAGQKCNDSGGHAR